MSFSNRPLFPLSVLVFIYFIIRLADDLQQWTRHTRPFPNELRKMLLTMCKPCSHRYISLLPPHARLSSSLSLSHPTLCCSLWHRYALSSASWVNGPGFLRSPFVPIIDLQLSSGWERKCDEWIFSPPSAEQTSCFTPDWLRCYTSYRNQSGQSFISAQHPLCKENIIFLYITFQCNTLFSMHLNVYGIIHCKYITILQYVV